MPFCNCLEKLRYLPRMSGLGRDEVSFIGEVVVSLTDGRVFLQADALSVN